MALEEALGGRREEALAAAEGATGADDRAARMEWGARALSYADEAGGVVLGASV